MVKIFTPGISVGPLIRAACHGRVSPSSELYLWGGDKPVTLPGPSGYLGTYPVFVHCAGKPPHESGVY